MEEKGEKPSDTYYFASGWSSTDDKQKDKLKYTRVPYVPNKECDYYKNFTYPGTEVVFGQLDVDSHFLCAGSVRDNGKNKGICFDDNNAGGKIIITHSKIIAGKPASGLLGLLYFPELLV